MVVAAGENCEVSVTLLQGTVLLITVVDTTDAELRTTISVRDSAGRELSGMLSLAELMLDGRFRTFPATAALSGTRFATGRLVPEELHI